MRNIKREEVVEENGFVVNTKGVLIEYRGFDKYVTIPREINGITITSIGDGILDFMWMYAFCDHENLVSIMIPDSVTSIGNAAFEECSSLTDIIIPDSVTVIGDNVFEGCSSLITIAIPNSISSIGNFAFSGCSNLTSITIPNSVTSIGKGVFSKCFGLRNIIIEEENITFINIDGVLFNKQQHSLLFYPPIKSDVSYVVSDGVISIEDYAFDNCRKLRSIVLPDTVTIIGKGAFHECLSLKDMTIPASVTMIGAYAFEGCSNLRSITIPVNVTSIKHYTFWECYSLESIFIYNDNIDIDEMNLLGDREKIVIYAHEGSTTEEYARRKGYKFCPLI